MIIRTLDIHPALGFETTDRWNVAVTQRDEQIRQIGQNPDDMHYRLWAGERIFTNNISKVLACFPGLNVIIGIARIYFNWQPNTSNPEKKAINARHIYRGVAEIFFLGPLLIIADVVQTFRDKGVVQDYRRAHPELFEKRPL